MSAGRLSARFRCGDDASLDHHASGTPIKACTGQLRSHVPTAEPPLDRRHAVFDFAQARALPDFALRCLTWSTNRLGPAPRFERGRPTLSRNRSSSDVGIQEYRAASLRTSQTAHRKTSYEERG